MTSVHHPLTIVRYGTCRVTCVAGARGASVQEHIPFHFTPFTFHLSISRTSFWSLLGTALKKMWGIVTVHKLRTLTTSSITTCKLSQLTLFKSPGEQLVIHCNTDFVCKSVQQGYTNSRALVAPMNTFCTVPSTVFRTNYWNFSPHIDSRVNSSHTPSRKCQ